ncbi:MAG TPA: hypothetical protein VGR53_10070 [Nitrososphaerales archaeon]|nr:hypothetical protein [Nitrososphaerales archaeon]
MRFVTEKPTLPADVGSISAPAQYRAYISLVPEQGLYFVAAPATQGAQARIIEYRIT